MDRIFAEKKRWVVHFFCQKLCAVWVFFAISFSGNDSNWVISFFAVHQVTKLRPSRNLCSTRVWGFGQTLEKGNTVYIYMSTIYIVWKVARTSRVFNTGLFLSCTLGWIFPVYSNHHKNLHLLLLYQERKITLRCGSSNGERAIVC